MRILGSTMDTTEEADAPSYASARGYNGSVTCMAARVSLISAEKEHKRRLLCL